MAKLKPGPGKQNRHRRYKEQGRKDINKRKRAERHKKRMERFKKRKEEGKCYQYKPIPYKEGSKEYIKEKKLRASKNVNHSTEFSVFDSVMRKLRDKLEKEKREEKRLLNLHKSIDDNGE